MDLSIVIPAHNEAARLPATLARIVELRRATGHALEVVVVDDGSTDDTVALAEAAAPELPLRALRFASPRGPGAAVRAGMLAAKGARVLISDADGPVPFEDLAPLWRALDEGFELAAGSRRLRPGSVELPQPLHRIAMGRAWSRLVRWLAPTAVRDTQCGFKLFTREAAHAIAARAQIDGFVFHVEMLLLAEALGLAVCEVPVRWRDVPGSKIHLVRDPASMLVDLIRLARKHERQRRVLQLEAAESRSTS